MDDRILFMAMDTMISFMSILIFIRTLKLRASFSLVISRVSIAFAVHKLLLVLATGVEMGGNYNFGRIIKSMSLTVEAISIATLAMGVFGFILLIKRFEEFMLTIGGLYEPKPIQKVRQKNTRARKGKGRSNER